MSLVEERLAKKRAERETIEAGERKPIVNGFSISGDVDKLAKEQMMEISIDKITESFDYQARKFFSEETINSLAENMKLNGFTQSIVVVRNGADTFKIVAGETRYRAAKQAKIPTLRALVFPEITPMQKLVSISMGENANRSDISPYELYLLCKKTLDDNKAISYREVAAYLGGTYSESAIKKAMAYENVHENIIMDSENGIFVNIKAVVAIRAAAKRLGKMFPELSSDEIYAKHIETIYEQLKAGEIEFWLAEKKLQLLGISKKNDTDRVYSGRSEIKIDTRFISEEDKQEIEEAIRKILKDF